MCEKGKAHMICTSILHAQLDSILFSLKLRKPKVKTFR